MVATYREALDVLMVQARDLAERLAAATLAGQMNEASALTYRLALLNSRASGLRDSAVALIEGSDLGAQATQAATRLVPEGLAAGIQYAAATGVAVGVPIQRMSEQAISNVVARLQPGTTANTWLRRFASSTAEQAVASLARSVSLGQGVDATVADLRRNLDGVGTTRIRTFVRTEVIGGMREGAIRSYCASPEVVGWIWNARPGACMVCQGMHGTEHSCGDTMYSHPNCTCSPTPKTVTMADLGADVPDTGLVYEDPNVRLGKMPVAEQVRILGPTRHAAFRSGDLDVRTIPAPTRHPEWGPGLRARTLRELGL